MAHHDHGVQYLSVAYTEHLDAAGIKPSTGAVGSSFDNALAETINGLYKTELIKPRRPWKGVDDLEIATAEWIDWFNHRRPFQYCDALTLNATAHRLGMSDTTYTDPSGYDDHTVSTALDQLRLAKVVTDNDTLTAVMATRSYTLPVAGRVTNTPGR